MKPAADRTSSGSGRVVIAGGDGFLGVALARALVREGHEPVVLTRNPAGYPGPGRALCWDGRTLDPGWAESLDGAAGLVNLTGCRALGGIRRNPRRELLRSRIESCEVLGAALRQAYRPPSVWVQASSLAIYGDAGDRLCVESAFVPGGPFAEEVVAWEEALGAAIRPEMRWASLRMGWVLGREGGVLPAALRLARCGLGGAIGGGRQWISWIHLEDLTRLFLETLRNPSIHGICNATGLQPVTNTEFMATLRRNLKVPLGLAAPAWLVRGSAAIIGADPDLVLTGRRALPCKIHGLGFRFRFHDLEDALADLVRIPPRPEREAEWAGNFAR